MYVRLGTYLLCPKHSFCYLQEENQYETCFCHFPSDLLRCLFSGRQVCIFPAALSGQVPDGRSAGSCSRTAVNNGAYGRIDLKRLTILPDKNIKSPSENSSRSRSKNLLLTGREGRTGEYWPESVAVRTERSEVRTKTTEGQYSPVRLELARLVSSLLYGTRAMLVLNLPAFKSKK